MPKYIMGIPADRWSAFMGRKLRELQAQAVVFEDGTALPVDAIIYATGYKTTFPFIDLALFQVKDGAVELYRRMVVPALPGLYMVGLVQPVGPTIPLVELQSRWLASVLAGETALPDEAAMREEIGRHQKAIASRYVGSARYALEVDFGDYARQLRGDIARSLRDAPSCVSSQRLRSRPPP